MRRASRRMGPRLAVVAGAAALGLAASGEVGAQEPEAVGPGEIPPAEEPPTARAPKQFRIAVTGGALTWAEEPERDAIENGAMVGLEIERRVGPFVAFRAGGGYGRSTAANDTAAVDLNQFLADVVASLRLAFGPLRRAGVVPFGTVGLATVVQDPESEELATKSQSAAAFGGGLDADLARSLGLRAEWRRYLVDSEDLFDPTDRTGKGRVVDRFYGGLYVKL